MSSESHRDIRPQPEPTCPMIDELIKSLNEVERSMRKFERCEDVTELRDMLNSVHRELFHWSSAEEQLEKIRKHVSGIREWGEEWKQYALAGGDEQDKS